MARTTSKPADSGNEVKDTAPVNIEMETPSTEAEAPKEAASKEKIETDVRTRLSRKSDSQDPFIPSSPAVLQEAAKEVAKERGFELTRGTEIGARLMARSMKNNL